MHKKNRAAPVLRLACAGTLLAALFWHYSERPAADATVTDDSRVGYLKLHVAKINSISPDDRDFSDLEPLRRAIGARRIVMLGEESHGDGATFLAKTRLIEFLHERMGFNVLAFESGFYDVPRAWADLESGVDPIAAIRSGIFSIWTNSAQTQALWRYVASQSRASHPLVLTGIDSQFTGAASKRYFLTDLQTVLAGLPQDAQIQDARARVFSVVSSYFPLRGEGLDGLQAFQKATTVAQQARFYIAMERLRQALSKQIYSDPAQASRRDYWVQLLAATSVQFEHMWHEDYAHFYSTPGPAFDWATFNLRDRQMGENLIWLARHEYANQKIIVWAATSHEMRHRNFFITEYTPYAPMGDSIDRAMGANVYTIGFTAFQGKAGTSEPWDIGSAAPDSIEGLIHGTREAYAFLDFRHLDEAGSWLTEPISCRVLGYQPEVSDWPASLDGLFYIETMTPSVPIPPPSG